MLVNILVLGQTSHILLLLYIKYPSVVFMEPKFITALISSR